MKGIVPFMYDGGQPPVIHGRYEYEQNKINKENYNHARYDAIQNSAH